MSVPTTSQITTLIVDDEQLAREELRYLLGECGGVEVVAEGANGIEAVELIEAHQPDLVILDVQMPGMDGFAVIKQLIDHRKLERLPQFVFATAYDQYAVRAFDVNAADYLLKPFDAKRIRQALDRVRARLAESQLDVAEVGVAGGEPLGDGIFRCRDFVEKPDLATARDLAKIVLETAFEGGRHERRVNKIAAMEGS